MPAYSPTVLDEFSVPAKTAPDLVALIADDESLRYNWRGYLRDQILWLLLPFVMLITWIALRHRFQLSGDLYRELALQGTCLGVVVLLLQRTSHKLRDAEVRTRAVVNHWETSQQKLEAIINSVDGIVWEADAQTFQFTFVSQKAVQILGYPVDQWISDPTFWSDHLHPDDRNGAVEFCCNATQEMRPHEFEYRMLAADGREVWVNDIVTVICEHGRPIKLRGLIVDITESKRAAATLQVSEARLQVAIQASNLGPWDWNLVTNEVHFSPEWKRQLGHADEEVAGHVVEFITRLHPDDHDRIMSSVQAYVEDYRVGYDVEFRMRHKDGSYRWIHTRATMQFDAADKPIRMLGCHLDITDRKQAESVLRESEENFHQLADNITDMFWIASPDMRKIYYVSPGYELIWGRPAASLYLHPREWVEAILPEDRERVIAEMSRYSATESNGAMEYRIARPDGPVRWIHSSGFQVRDDAGKVIRVTGIARDITDQKRDEAELASLHQKLLDASRQAGMAEIATNVLHNVGNVLNSVNVSATLVTENIKNSKASALARVVELMKHHASDLGEFITSDVRGKQLPAYLAQLSEHLLAEQATTTAELNSLQGNISHIKEIVAMQQNYARVSGAKEIVNVIDLLEDSIRINAGALLRHGVEVVREFETVPLINVDKHKVLQILVNLVRNAKYACSESTRDDRFLWVRAAQAAGQIQISVTDNGVGIPAENLTRIFQHGFTTRESGHGFGLHSGALAAKEMGGSLAVHSDGIGQGARFTLELPAQSGIDSSTQNAVSSATIKASPILAERAAHVSRLLILMATSLLTLLFSSPAFALDPAKSVFQFNCQNWTRQTGLPVDMINAVTQTDDGYIWLGTQNGLVRFDGAEFNVVPIALPEANGQSVGKFSKSKDGGMWFAINQGGFGAYDGRKFTAIEDERWTKPDTQAQVILEARDGAVWTGSDFGMGRWVKGKPEESVFNLVSHVAISSMCEDSESRLWFGSVEQGLYCWKDGTLAHVTDELLKKRIVFAIAATPDGRIWVGTQLGLSCYAANGQEIPIHPMTTEVRSLFVDRHGVLWIGTRGQGLARYQNGVFTYFKKADGLVSDHINSLFEDAEGSLWVGARDGLSQLTDLKFPIYSNREGLIEGSNLSVTASKNGGVWIATSTGISYFDGKLARNYGDELPLSNHYVKRVFEARNGDVYLADGDKNINVLSGDKFSKVYPNVEWPIGFAEDSVSVLTAIGGTLVRIQDGELRPFQYNKGQQPTYYWITNLLTAKDGTIWVASVNGIIRIRDGNSTRWSMEDGLSGNKIQTLCEDDEGNIWAGTSTGLARIKNDQVTMISQLNGLHDDRIYAIVADDLGSFWFASGRGFFRIERQGLNDFAEGKSTRVQCEVFDQLESIKFTDRTDQEFSGCKSLDGRIWFPNPQGVVVIDPRNIPTNTVAPPVHISRVRANTEEFTSQEAAVISPGDGELEIHFTALSFIAPHRIPFRYRLEGYDDDWVDAGDRRMAFYTNLKPGRYSFQVIAANADGVWNLDGDTFNFQLLPHFHQSTWFTLLVFGLVLTVLASLYMWRVRHLEFKQQSLQKSRDLLEREIQSRTAELANANSSLQKAVEDHILIEGQLERRTELLEDQIEERQRMQLEVERVHRQLLDASRQAGMAEIATNVLHNVGNVLNSVNISACLVAESVKKSKASSLTRVVTLLQEHEHDLGAFFANDAKAQQLPNFLAQLSEHLQSDREATVKELELLRGNIDHIKHIVAMQQTYAKVSGIREVVNIVDRVEDGLRMIANALDRHGVEVVRDFESVPPLELDKHRVLQILVNLLQNAKNACDESGRSKKLLTLRIVRAEDRISISVIDNGVGIPPENLVRIFNYGFTTRETGHGFGLHGGALAAREMGGSLIVHSDGVGHGATFILELPLSLSENDHE